LSVTVVNKKIDSFARKYRKLGFELVNKSNQRPIPNSTSSSSSLFSMHHQCVALLAANSPHSGLSRAISIASSKVRLCRIGHSSEWPSRRSGVVPQKGANSVAWLKILQHNS